MKKTLFIISLLCFLISPGHAQLVSKNETGLVWMTEEYPPYNYQDADGNLTGISVEILLNIMKRLNIQFIREDILVLPWARGYKETLETPNTALFTMNKSEHRAQHFKFVGPISPSKISVFTINPEFKISGVYDLSLLNIDVVRNDIGEQTLDKPGLKPSAKTKLPTSLETIRMLLLKRVDAIVLDETIARFEFNRLGVTESDYFVQLPLAESTTHFAFNKNVSDDFLTNFSKAFLQLKTEGYVDKVYEKYRLSTLHDRTQNLTLNAKYFSSDT